MLFTLNALQFYLLVYSEEKGVTFLVFGYCTVTVLMQKQISKIKKKDKQMNFQLIPQIKRKSTRQSLLINKISESINLKWSQTLQSFPIGILILKKINQEILFENEQLLEIFQGFNDIGNFIIHQLECTIINPKKQINAIQRNTSIVLDNKQFQASDQFNSLRKTPSQYTVEQVLNLLRIGRMSKYLTKDDQLELSATFYRGNEVFQEERNLLLKISNSYGENEFFIIIQDISLQTNLKKLETREKFIVKMIDSFSHELKTPLNSAELFLQAISETHEVPSNLQEGFIDPARNSLRLQAYIIRDIIDFTQFSSCLIKYNFSDINFIDIIQEINDLFKLVFQHKRIGLHINTQKSIPNVINSDFNRIMQILVNILQNSVKFSSNGVIDIKIQGYDGYVLFSIKDQGIGIEQFQLQKIQTVLQNFALTRNISNQQEWQGLGLLISQINLLTLAPQNKQYLQIASKGLHHGVEIKFRIKTQTQASTQQFTHHHLLKRGSLNTPNTVPDFSEGITGQLTYNFECRDQKSFDEKYSLKGSFIGGIILSKLVSTVQLKLKIAERNRFINSRDISFCYISHPDTDRCGLSQCLIQVQQNHTPKFLQQSYERQFQRNSTLLSKMMKRNDSQSQIHTHFNNLKFRCKCQRTLSVDDDSFNQKALQLILQQMGFEITLAYNGQQAIDIVKSTQPCSQDCHLYIFILMDCQMPILDGWQTTKRLRSMMKSNLIPFIPIIGLTAFNGSIEIDRCLECGMQTVLSKPLNIFDFKQALLKLYQFSM